LRYKAIPDAVNGLHFGKTIIIKCKGVKFDFKNKFFLPSLLKILCFALSQYTQNNPISPNTGPI
jgi:hypothetical protein